MGYGILIRNDAKTIVIDGEAPNYCLVARGYVATDSNGPGLDFTSVSISLAGMRAPVVATSCTAGSYGIVYYPASGDKWVTLVAKGPIGTAINYWVFDDPDNVPEPKGWGIVIRNPITKKVVFAIGQKPMQVVDFFGYSRGDSTVRNYPSGRAYAFVAVGIAGDGVGHPWAGGGGHGPWTYVETRQAIAIADTAVSIVSGEYSETSQPDTIPIPPNFFKSARALVLDVTGY